MKEIKVPRDLAFVFRNRLVIRDIPFMDLKVTSVLVKESHYAECKRILDELKTKKLKQELKIQRITVQTHNE